MRRIAVVVLVVALAGCGGIQPYWADDDAGRCVEHASQDDCLVSPGPCIDGGPAQPTSANMPNTAYVKCSN